MAIVSSGLLFADVGGSHQAGMRYHAHRFQQNTTLQLSRSCQHVFGSFCCGERPATPCTCVSNGKLQNSESLFGNQLVVLPVGLCCRQVQQCCADSQLRTCIILMLDVATTTQVDNYVKAFYIPWDDLGRWSQVHVAEYGKAKIMVLVECMAEAHGIKRTVKAALIEKLNAELAEFA